MTNEYWERDVKILKARKNGLTFREIAADFGISPSRVSQIVWSTEIRIRRGLGAKGKDSDTHAKSLSITDDLSTRARNALLYISGAYLIKGNNNDAHRQRDASIVSCLASLTESQLMGMNNVGTLTIYEISRWATLHKIPHLLPYQIQKLKG